MEENVVNQQTIESELNLSDEYLAKKKRNRKITFSIISFVTLVLAVVIIVLSSINVNLKPTFIDGANRYEITIGNRYEIYEQGQEGFDEFDKLFDETFSLNYLSALFSGKLGGYTLTDENESLSDKFYGTNNAGMSTTLSKALGSNYVRVKLSEDQQVKYSNGKVYKSKYNRNYDLKFNEVYFNLHSENQTEKLTFYLGVTSQAYNTNETKIFKINVNANTFALYDFVNEK